MSKPLVGALLCSCLSLACSSPREGTADAGPEPLPQPGDDASAARRPDDGPTPEVPADRAGPPPDTGPPEAIPPGHHRLTVKVTGPGVVTGAPGGSACRDVCTHDVPMGTSIELQAGFEDPADRPTTLFQGWEQDCSGKGVCRVTVDRDRTVSARFHRWVVWEISVPAGSGFQMMGDDVIVFGSFTGSTSVLGSPVVSRGDQDGFLARLDANRKLQWLRTFGGPMADRLTAVRVARDGELLVAGQVGSDGVQFGGRSLGAAGSFIAGLHPDEDQLRVSIKGGNGTFTLDQADNFVLLEAMDPGDDYKYGLSKRDRNGGLLWSKPPLLPDRGYSLGPAIDRSEDVVVAHDVNAPVTLGGTRFVPENGRLLLIKYGTDGTFRWARQLTNGAEGTSPGGSRLFDLRFDDASNIYLGIGHWIDFRIGGIGGTSIDAGLDVAVARLTRDGTPVWFRTFGSPIADHIMALAVDRRRVWLVGQFAGGATIGTDMHRAASVLIQLDPASGNVLSTLDPRRPISALLPQPSGDLMFRASGASDTILGRLSLP